MKKKDRVRVAVREGDRGWRAGAVKAMNGQAGVVVDVQNTPTGQMYCVHFDEPLAPWLANQLPVRSFFFESHELEILP